MGNPGGTVVSTALPIEQTANSCFRKNISLPEGAVVTVPPDVAAQLQTPPVRQANPMIIFNIAKETVALAISSFYI